jgi:CheY-like chemotaxis protein
VNALKLLVVEDDLANLELMTEVFTSLQATVRALSDSVEAAIVVEREKFDGIFLDLEMPNLNGFQLAQKIRESSWNKATPVVIVTGREQRDTMYQSFALGATFFLQKPVDRHKLSNLFRTVRGPLFERRRRYVRVPLSTEVTCNTGPKTVKGRTWNLSQGGMQVEVGGLKQNESVQLSFRLPASATEIEASGVVAWVREERQGIHFTKMSVQNQQEVRDFIGKLELSPK